ncbi:MAG: UDP-N-acetylmuramate--L-alanine ligase [Candidatus Omnitrophica bacterium]|nr:UDP-N-acetylmuramate--L-alanine ligase [Candidatus Omnitrophota bacterium]
MKNIVKKGHKKTYRHYHFIGVGGMGMGNLALLMLAKGFTVSGSDVKESELTRQLSEKGARIYIGHDTRNLEGADCVVYSSAITTTNPEMFRAVSEHIPILRRAELLAQLVNKEVGVTVAGAHGKTTTSSMASLLLIKAGLKPTTAVGGIINQGDYNANLGIGRHMVAEVDESDGSFLYFSPHFSIITNIDFEHVDYYHTWEKIKEAYAMFVERTVPGGVVIACGDDAALREILSAGGRRFVTYGFGEDNEWIAKNIHCDAQGSSYDCYHKGKFVSRFGLSIPGKHNVLNSLSVVILGHELKIELGVIADALLSFSGVKRRFQKKGEVNGVLVIDDYGHHPTEIAATLQTAKTLDRKRVITVFQPHRYTRTKFLMEEFTNCFHLSDRLILTDIYAASEKPIAGISTEVLVEKIREKRTQSLQYLPKEKIVDELLSIVQPGDLVLTLGAGDVTHISDELVRRLHERGGVSVLTGIHVPSKAEAGNMGVVGVIMGGCSSEREVSIKSGSAIVKALVAVGTQVKPIDLTTEDRGDVKNLLREAKIDMAFIALHGRFGEDGGIQSVLEELDIPYNGCGPAASYAAFNKCVSQRIFEAKGITTPKTVIVEGGKENFDPLSIVTKLGGFPLVVKPACEGSSLGVGLARDNDQLQAAAQKAFDYGKDIVIQECILGRELTVGILGKTPLPVVEIRAHSSQHSFFDFQAKYKDQSTQYIVPAEISHDIVLRVQHEALKAYEAAGCEGFGRVDVLLDADGVPFVLEINTIPGFTATSLLPKAAKAVGLDFEQLCLTLIDMAYGKKKTELPASLR